MTIVPRDYADAEKTLSIARPPCPIRHGVVAFDVDSLPSEPGIYFAWNGEAEIAYVGQATNIQKRASVSIKQGVRDGGKIMACDILTWVTCSVYDLDWMERYYIRYLDPSRNGRDKLSFSLGSADHGSTVAMGAVALIGSQASAVCSISIINHRTHNGKRYGGCENEAYVLGNGSIVRLNRLWQYPPGAQSRRTPQVPFEMTRSWVPDFAKRHQEIYYGSFMSRWDDFPMCQQILDAACKCDIAMLRLIAANFNARFPLLYRPQGERGEIKTDMVAVDYDDQTLADMAKNGDELDQRTLDSCVKKYQSILAGVSH